MWKKCCPCIRRTYEPPDVQELDYRHCSLCEVPPEIFTYERTLEKLDLASNQISDLPPSLFHCHELRELDLCDNDLKEIPAAIESLNRLAKLDISRNALSEIPDTIKNCKSLTYLDLSLNQLTKLPEAICQLVHLEELFLNETALEFLPANFGRLTKLKILELRENLLQTLPKSMSRLHQLQRLDIGSNDIEELPEVIGTMTNLTELWADNNCIRDVPKFIGNLTKLSCLDLSKNDVGEISNEIGRCTNLSDMTLTQNSLSMLPDTITKLENLITIRIDCNRLLRLPEDIGKLKNLQELSAVNNLLKSVPLSIGLLRKLHTLYLDENRLGELPIEIGSCTSLTVLSVAKNNLMNVPSEVGHLSKLKMLKLTNNSIQNLPVSILGLTDLGALWLTDGQNKPLVALNREVDPATGQHVVTCCLLPQLSMPDIDVRRSEGEDLPPRRSERKIRFQNEVEPPAPEKPAANGGLLRAPTPYPKELRALAKHASHIRQAKSQNGEAINYSDEPMYEGDFAEDNTMEHLVKERYELEPLVPKSNDVPLPSDNHEESSSENLLEHANQDPVPYAAALSDKLEEEKTMLTWTAPEANPCLNTIGLPEIPYNQTSYLDDLPQVTPSFAIGRTPPPYHIAAKRAAFFRSSGGAGSGKMNFPTDTQPSNAEILNQNEPMPTVPPVQYVMPENNEWHPGAIEVEDPNYIAPSSAAVYSEIPPAPSDNLGFNETTNTVQYSEANYPANFEYSGILPDKNANITAAKIQYSLDMTDNVNSNIPQQQIFLDEPSTPCPNYIEIKEHAVMNSIATEREEPRPAIPTIESRIPMLSSQKSNNINPPTPNSLSDSKVSRIPSIHGNTKRNQYAPTGGENVQTSSSAPEVTVPPSSLSKDRIPSKLVKSGIPMQYDSKLPPPAKVSMSTSKIPNKFSEEKPPFGDGYKTGTSSVGNLKFASGIPKSSTKTNVTSSAVSQSPSQNQDLRKSNSRIPKFDVPRTASEDISFSASSANEEKKPDIPSYAPVPPEKAISRGVSPKPSKSGIPKPPIGRTPSPTGSKIPMTRKPWIFGSHKNARVVSVEHTKVNQFLLGFVIDDFAGHISPPEGKGIYVTATDSDDLPIKIGDKILQVDGIDVGNMGVEIVNKILGNCQENIQLLVSRQQ